VSSARSLSTTNESRPTTGRLKHPLGQPVTPSRAPRNLLHPPYGKPEIRPSTFPRSPAPSSKPSLNRTPYEISRASGSWRKWPH
jgi:hypothetical protein